MGVSLFLSEGALSDADSMLAAGGQYTRDNAPNMRILSMMILYGLDLWTTMSPLLTPRWQQGIASLKRLLGKSGKKSGASR
jgi:hypothetical protein